MPDLSAHRDLDYCYLTTIGRSSGEPREIEIWFALEGETLYLLAGGRDASHWVRNIMKQPAVTIRLGGETYAARGRILAAGTDEDALARRLLVEKYTPRHGRSLDEWGRTALPVAFDL